MIYDTSKMKYKVSKVVNKDKKYQSMLIIFDFGVLFLMCENSLSNRILILEGINPKKNNLVIFKNSFHRKFQ